LKRRPNILILMRLLELLIEEPKGPTRLAQAANLNYQKCEEFLDMLSARGLVEREIREGHDTFSVTLKGRTLFASWAKIYEELDLS
jgi:predicted transcriptional regulator